MGVCSPGESRHNDIDQQPEGGGTDGHQEDAQAPAAQDESVHTEHSDDK